MRGRSAGVRDLSVALLLGSFIGSFTGCADAPETAESAADESEGIPEVPVPPADGPKLFVLQHGLSIAEAPSEGAKIIGWLRAGAAVARSETAISYRGCEAGWYAVRPRGFVCLGESSSLGGGPTTLPEPELGRALPYRYAELSSASPRYGRLPTPEEQHEAEPDLKKHFARRDRQKDGDIGHSATDVPLDEHGVPTGPPVLLPESVGATAEGNRTRTSYFDFGSDMAPPPTPFDALTGTAKAAVLRRGSGIAVMGTVMMAEGPSGQRRFAVTADGSLIPLDRLDPAMGSTYHGLDLREHGLPIAFVHKYGTEAWTLDGSDKAEPLEDELLRRTAVPMTGRFRTVHGVRYDEAKDGFWLRARDIIRVVKRSKLPDFASGKQKWVDISIAMQYAVLYEGTTPVYATLVSSGRDMLGDPATSASTPLGTFRVRAKHIARDLDPIEVDRSFDVADAPWVLELESDNAIVGSYWDDDAGQASMHHDIAMTPIDAHRLFQWADPQIPEGWHGVTADDGQGTLVNVRK
jgi:hypothetical protein